MKELELIKKIRKKTATSGGGLFLGIGDDCAVIEKDKDNFFVWASDMITEGSHFRLKDEYERIGRKAVAVNISDVAAMGAVPKYITVSIGIPSRMKMSEVVKVYDGIHRICGEYGILIAGGDTIRSSKLTIDVSVIGIVKKKDLITRSGAKERELILVTGPVRDGKKEHLDFSPRLAEARFLARKYNPGAMIDISDGIALDAHRVCEASGTGCFLYEENIPLSSGLALKDALYYGESFELLFTMSVEKAQKLPPIENNKGLAGFFVIGVVTSSSKGMKILDASGKVRKIELKGYDHLAGSR